MMAATALNVLVFVGTYTERGSEGIYVYRMDGETGALVLAAKATESRNPSFLALDPARRTLYVVEELAPDGTVVAYAIDPGSGKLTFLNRQPTHGGAPCHVAVDRTGRLVLVANYVSGNVCVLPVGEGGRLLPATQVLQHEGAGPNAQRQEGPHAHSVTVSPDNRFAIAADLGTDKLMVYRLDAQAARLTANDPPWAALHPGAGPRHVAFHPSGRFLYAINELDSTLTAFAYDAETGALTELQTVPTLPAGFTGHSTCADVHTDLAGRFLYGSNRGHDSLAIYRIENGSGRLTPIGHEPTQGKNPRNFALDPSGRFLYAADQDSDSIVVFRVDPNTGKLTATGHVTQVSMPVCLRFAITP
jgi:6-phosphogluconolactonase